MPTENRSSNTDPRDVFIRLNPLGLDAKDLRKDSTGFQDPRTHSDYLLFLAGYRETHAEPQPHPEPIAWMVGTAIWWTKEEAERDAAEVGQTVVGLGPMTECSCARRQCRGCSPRHDLTGRRLGFACYLASTPDTPSHRPRHGFAWARIKAFFVDERSTRAVNTDEHLGRADARKAYLDIDLRTVIQRFVVGSGM